MKWQYVIVALAALCLSSSAQQPNSAVASAVWQGVNGPPWPLAATVSPYATSTLSFTASSAPNRPFILVYAPAGLTSPGMGTPFGLVDVNLAGGLEFLMDGISFTTGSFFDYLANTGTSGVASFTFSLTPSLSGIVAGLQCAFVDPSNPAGLTLSAATLLTINQALAGIFVSISTGTPGNLGTMAAPLSSISAGIALAVHVGAPYPQVYVAQGTYNETLNFADGVSVLGGFDPTTWGPTSVRSIVMGGATAASATSITSPTSIWSLDVRAANGVSPGGPSIAVSVSGCSPALQFLNCRFQSGIGAPGTSGMNGVPGFAGGATALAGLPGSPGQAGAVVGPPGAGGPGMYGCQGGTGGTGGAQGGTAATVGFQGGCSGGTGGSFTPPPFGPGPNGGAGASGATGLAGLLGPQGGSIVGGAWIASVSGSGTSGGMGTGGGGGAGGSGSYYCVNPNPPQTGGSGGGGGGGGQGSGAGGTGGTQGGASFAAYVFDSTPGFVGCELISGPGGASGTGGNGAAGGPGGIGGAGGAGVTLAFPCASNPGGSGGPGGAGGPSGGGAGGHGGPSWCVYQAGTSAVSFTGNNTFLPGTGGAGGAGGLHGNGGSYAPPGLTGSSGTIGP